MKLLLALPICAADIPLATSLLKCLASLGPYPGHALLVIASHGLHKDQYQPLLDIAKPLFDQGELIHTPFTLKDESHPYGTNFRFETAAFHVQSQRKLPFLWLDPRCVPTRRGWLNDIEESYFAQSRTKPFMGQLLTPKLHGTSEDRLSSVAVYPATLPKLMIQRLMTKRGVEWEQSCADLVVPHAQETGLIWTQPLTGDTPRCLPADVPNGVALAHTAAARMLAAAFRGEPVAVIEASAPQPVSAPAPKPVTPAPQQPAPVSVAPKPAYYHSGNLGDVIYALAAIRLAGGGKLILGPKQRKTPPCSSPIKAESFEMLAPLLAAQPYVTKSQFTERHPGTDAAFDLNTYRRNWQDSDIRTRTGIRSIVGMHCYTLGVFEKFKTPEPWLTVPDPIELPYYTVHRSPRYQSDDFPWEILLKRFAGRLLFVGLSSEHSAFHSKFNVSLPFWKCADFLDLARVIAGSAGFIGNQSFPMSIALGLGKNVLQESWAASPDCVLPRPGFITQPFTDKQLDEWESMRPVAIKAQPAPAPKPAEPIAQSAPVVLTSKPKARDWFPSIYEQTHWECGQFQFPSGSASDPRRGVCFFNPSIENYNGKTILFTRQFAYQYKHHPREGMIGDSSIALFQVDPGTKALTGMRSAAFVSANPINQWEDPRTVQHNSKLYLSCATWRYGGKAVPHYNGAMVKQSLFQASPTLETFTNVGFIPAGDNGRQWQKNWLFFFAEDKPYLIYTLSPFVAYRLDHAWQPGGTITHDKPKWHPKWPHSPPRGGSNPVLIGDEFVTFFHAHSDWRGKKRRYYMGAMAFSAKPPFNVTRYTPEPLLTGSEEDPRVLSGPLVVFPCGSILKHGKQPSWFVALGVNDENCAWIDIPHADLEKRMERP